jgi:hypothetical protein
MSNKGGSLGRMFTLFCEKYQEISDDSIFG